MVFTQNPATIIAVEMEDPRHGTAGEGWHGRWFISNAGSSAQVSTQG
jgi:hypothetical protein